MKPMGFLGFVAALVLLAPMASAQWKPADGPLMTRWAKDVSPEKAHPEYPRPGLVREKWLNLNGLWEFAPAKEGQEPPIGKGLDRRILVPFPVESALSGVMEHHERLWYRRTFEVPGAWSGKDAPARVMLHFGAVDWEATVHINGKKVGAHRGGYDAFSFDVTDALKPSGPQELVVEVFDPADGGTQPRGKQVRKPEGIWYTPTTGIWQTVWLEPVDTTHVTGFRATTRTLDGQADLAVSLTNASPDDSVGVIVRDGDKRVFGPVYLNPLTLSTHITIPGAKAWSPESPQLYDLELSVRRGARVLDEVRGYVALRTISVAKDEKGVNRIMLNGKPYFQVGPLDQGFWPDGLYTAPTDEAMKYDLEVTKRLGFNMIRKHVKVEPARWYTWCDRLGILVWQDMPSGEKYIGGKDPDITRTPESGAQFEVELRAMIDGLRNHPSIVMWVPYNEGWGQWDTARIVTLIKDYDPTRLVNNTSGWTDRGVGDVNDIHVYPGPGAPKAEEKRAGVLGEFGGLGLAIPEHTWSKKSWGYRGTTDRADLTEQYVDLLRRVHELKETSGLCAAVYTQTTDVETECNGLLTYDRAIVKMDEAAVANANRGVFPRVVAVEPTADERAAKWRYTFDRPPTGWERGSFDDSSWRTGDSGFGTQGTPGAHVGTVWNGSEIWLRRSFELPRAAPDRLRLRVHHDEDAEVYINGVLAWSGPGYTSDYRTVAISREAVGALQPAGNVLAVHCKQTVGGQYIDVGIVELVPPQGQAPTK